MIRIKETVALGIMLLMALVLPLSAVAAPEAKPDQWTFVYAVPEGVTSLALTLSYNYWDPKVDGDVSSNKTLLQTTIKIKAGQEKVPLQITLTEKGSKLVAGDTSETGKGFLLDSTFARAEKPKPNFDGFYVLAQKPVDAKKPAAMGETQDASAWIELGITPKP